MERIPRPYRIRALLVAGILVAGMVSGQGQPASDEVSGADAGSDAGNDGSAATGRFEPSLEFAQVEAVTARRTASGAGETTWSFSVTVRHDDDGWEHYADRWQVIDPATGAILGERVLLHPHETEQPFTRSQSGIIVPNETGLVIVLAACNVHGFGGREVAVDLSVADGDRFDVRH